MHIPKRRDGFSLIEIMVVVAILGLLAAIATQSVTHARRKSRATRMAEDLRTFGDAFQLYCMEKGDYPPDATLADPNRLPPGAGMESYLTVGKWAAVTPVGGHYDWEGLDAYPFAGIAIADCVPTEGTMLIVDEILDNGNLATGRFRLTAENNHYTYILKE